MEESARADLMLLAARFSDVEGISLQAVGLRALKDNTFFRRIAQGSGFNVRTYDRLVVWFSENWPDGAKWPTEVVRPLPQPVREVAAE